MALPKSLEASGKRLAELEREAKKIGTTIRAVRDSLLALMKIGKVDAFSTDDSSFTIVKPERAVIREEELKGLLKKKGIPLTAGFDKVYILNERKVLTLIKEGLITKKQLKKITDIKLGNQYIRMGRPKEGDNLAGTIKKAQKGTNAQH